MSEEKIKHLHVSRMRNLQEIVGFLDSYKPVKGEKHVVKNDDSDIVNEEMSALLVRLGEINQERDFIISKLMGWS